MVGPRAEAPPQLTWVPGTGSPVGSTPSWASAAQHSHVAPKQRLHQQCDDHSSDTLSQRSRDFLGLQSLQVSLEADLHSQSVKHTLPLVSHMGREDKCWSKFPSRLGAELRHRFSDAQVLSSSSRSLWQATAPSPGYWQGLRVR